jgi:hypothetical protein
MWELPRMREQASGGATQLINIGINTADPVMTQHRSVTNAGGSMILVRDVVFGGFFVPLAG